MVVSIRDIGNITFRTLAFQIPASNIALEFDINMDNGFTVNNIIYSESGKNNKVRGCSLTPRAYSSRSILPSIALDSRDKSYHDKVQ